MLRIKYNSQCLVCEKKRKKEADWDPLSGVLDSSNALGMSVKNETKLKAHLLRLPLLYPPLFSVTSTHLNTWVRRGTMRV